jgi:hypothetical protein
MDPGFHWEQVGNSGRMQSAHVDLSHAGDDGGNATVASTTTVIPAQAGIQCLSSYINRFKK